MVFKKTFEKQIRQINNGFTLSIPMDVRRQVKELGSNIFGNGLMFHHLKINTAELDKLESSELVFMLRKSMPLVKSESYLEFINDLESAVEGSSIHSLKPYDPENGCHVTNLSRMPIQKLNFGSGSPEFVFLLTIGRNSTAILADKEDYLLRLVY